MVDVPDLSTIVLPDDWTEASGSPTYVTRDHCDDSAVLGNGTDIRLERDSISVLNDVGWTGAIWLKAGVQSSDAWLFSQLDNGANVGIFIILSGGGNITIDARSSGSRRTSSMVSSVSIDNDVNNYLMFSVNGNTGSNDAQLRMVINAVEPSYATLNAHSNNGFDVMTSTAVAQKQVLGGAQHLARYVDGSMDRPKIWRSGLSVADMITVSNQEIAKKGSCDLNTPPTIEVDSITQRAA